GTQYFREWLRRCHGLWPKGKDRQGKRHGIGRCRGNSHRTTDGLDQRIGGYCLSWGPPESPGQVRRIGERYKGIEKRVFSTRMPNQGSRATGTFIFVPLRAFPPEGAE